ncbi:MAG: AAA family ATPase, partial [Candidatus Sumerlaeota bacterium]|nr:AAA family ATPase [Candidatus Sumerlaeota bacterium]
NPGYQNMLVGQGKPGDILRNLLLEVYRMGGKDENGNWQSLVKTVDDLFGYELLDPQYAELTDPFIRIEYRHRGSRTAFDIASAGSGFHQVLTLLGFLHARPASVLLLDEPDAHLHVILQRQVYNRLRMVARQRECQLLVSTHSEVLLEDTAAEQILSFYGQPHRLEVETHRDQVREALKRLSSLEILSAESGQNILFVEDESDFKLLAEFARVLAHPMQPFFDKPFFYPIHGRDAREAKAHFFALRAIRPSIAGVLLLDGDNRDLQEHDIAADNLEILRWRRYEIENYLLHPEALLRFVERPQGDMFVKKPRGDMFAVARRMAGMDFLRANLPPSALTEPLTDIEYLLVMPASKSLLPGFFESARTSLSKKDYYQIAAGMMPDEIHPEIREKLDAMAKVLKPEEAAIHE